MTVIENGCRNSNHTLPTPLKIQRTIYENLPVWYRTLADFLAKEGSVEIIPDDVTHGEVRS